MEHRPHGQWQVYDSGGRRKYLNGSERARFLAAADQSRADARILAYVLVYTGCRISEALALGPDHHDTDALTLTFRTLKRRQLCFRTVPIPPRLSIMLKTLPAERGRFWPMHRSTAWRHVKSMLDAAGIEGPMGCCRGLRHGFGIHAALTLVPPSLIQRWMGHALATTTAIYLDAVDAEERAFAERMWT
jgi:integrase